MDVNPLGRGYRFFRAVDAVLVGIANVALVVIVLTICWTVWTRYVMRTPVVWAEDVTSLTFAWFIFTGMAAVYNRRGHVSIDILTTNFPPPLQRLVEKLVDVIVAAFSAYTAFLCAEQAVVSHTKAHTPVLELPLSLLFGAMALGFGLMAVRAVCYLMGIAPLPMHDIPAEG